MYRLLFLSLVFALTACKSTPNYLNTNQLATEYKTVGFVTFKMESDLRYFQSEMESFYKPKISAELEKRGFKVVDSSKVYEVMEELEKNATDLFNPNTGQKNVELENQLFEQALQTVASELGVDSFLFAGIDSVRASFSNNILLGHNARWNGQSEVYLADGVDAGAILSTLFTQESGYLPGARLYLRFRDPNNAILSVGAGGIELLARFDDDGEIQAKTSEFLFDDESQLLEALQLAFDDLDSHKQRKK